MAWRWVIGKDKMGTLLRGVYTTVLLDFCSRSFVGNLGRASLLALLPISLVWTMRQVGEFRQPAEFQEAMMVFVLLPGLVCVLGQLLWASPIVQAGMEENLWTTVGVRPYGKQAFLLGRYLRAVLWTSWSGWGGLVGCVWLIPLPNWQHTAVVFGGLILLSALAYGALLVFLGTLFPRRAMVAGVTYLVFVEALAGTMPALIHHLSVQYHLRSLLFQWVDLPGRATVRTALRWLQEEIPAWVHLGALAIYTIVLLALTLLLLTQKELVKPEEN